MGLATNLALFMLCLSFVMYLMGYGTMLTEVISCFQNPGKTIVGGGTCQTQLEFAGINLWSLINNQMLQVGTAIGIVAVVGLFGASTVFSIIGMSLFGLATFPIDLLNSDIVPTELKMFIAGFYGFGFIVAMISWLKIGGTP